MSEIDIFKEIEFFQTLDEESLKKLAELSEVKEYKVDDHVFQENDESRELYIILAGQVKITKTISPGVEKVLAVAGSGSLAKWL